MPLVLDEDCRGLTGFDTQSASTLYWKAIPVLLRQQEREDVTEELTFRILSGVMRQNHNLRVGAWIMDHAAIDRGLIQAGPCKAHSHLCSILRCWMDAQVLRIHVSSEEDSFFLHTLEVSEEDFQSLKVEQVGGQHSRPMATFSRCAASRE